MMLHPRIPVWPPASRFFLRCFNPTLRVGYQFIVQPVAALVAGVINPPARNKRSHWLNDELVSDPQRWIEAAQEKPGSWWPDWDAWMKHHSSGTIPAPTELGNAQYHPIE